VLPLYQETYTLVYALILRVARYPSLRAQLVDNAIIGLFALMIDFLLLYVA